MCYNFNKSHAACIATYDNGCFAKHFEHERTKYPFYYEYLPARFFGSILHCSIEHVPPFWRFIPCCTQNANTIYYPCSYSDICIRIFQPIFHTMLFFVCERRLRPKIKLNAISICILYFFSSSTFISLDISHKYLGHVNSLVHK